MHGPQATHVGGSWVWNTADTRDFRVVVDGVVRLTTNNLYSASRFAARFGGTLQRRLFGEWVS